MAFDSRRLAYLVSARLNRRIRDTSMPVHLQLNPDEQFVIEALARKFAAVWTAGQNPPDAYLTFDSHMVAVEITTITQRITDDQGSRPRASDDAVMQPMIDRLNSQLLGVMPKGYSVGLVIRTPVLDGRKTTNQLASLLMGMLNTVATCPKETNVDIRGNKITICINSRENLPLYDCNHVSKIWGVCQNRASSPDILANTIHSLQERIATKQKKCASLIKQPIWLALLNDYWLADSGTFDRAFSNIQIEHSFEKILLIGRDGQVHKLFER